MFSCGWYISSVRLCEIEFKTHIAEHIGKLVSVMEEIHTNTLWDSYADFASWTYNHLLDHYSKAETEVIIPNSGDILIISQLESIHILAPDSSFVK